MAHLRRAFLGSAAKEAIAVTVRRGLELVGWFLAGAASLLFVVIAPGLPHGSHATADPGPYTCLDNGDYGVIVAAEKETYYTARGTQASMYVGTVPAGGQYCQRISSIYGYSPDGSAGAEVGWVTGWTECPVGTTFYNDVPRVFHVGVKLSGEYRCMFDGSFEPPEGTYQEFRVSDTNGNGTWNAYYNDAYVGSINLDFAFGRNGVGMERGESADSGYARWRWLDEYKFSNGWTRWDNATCVRDADPDYGCHRENAYTVSSQRD